MGTNRMIYVRKMFEFCNRQGYTELPMAAIESLVGKFIAAEEKSMRRIMKWLADNSFIVPLECAAGQEQKARLNYEEVYRYG